MAGGLAEAESARHTPALFTPCTTSPSAWRGQSGRGCARLPWGSCGSNSGAWCTMPLTSRFCWSTACMGMRRGVVSSELACDMGRQSGS